MQEHVHDTKPGGVVHDLPTVEGLEAKMALLVRIEQVVVRRCIVRCEEEPTGAAGRIAYRHARLGPHHFDHCLDQRAGREVLARSRLHVLGVLLQQPLVGIAFHVSVERHPVLAVDQVEISRLSFAGSWMRFWLLRNTTPTMPGSAPEFGEDVTVVDLQIVTVTAREATASRGQRVRAPGD